MANRRDLVKRRKAVHNTRKITRTMQMIATARFQAASARAVATKPYCEKLAELVADLARGGDGIDHPLMREVDGTGRSALVVLTSNRGFCGGFNANVLRRATAHIDACAGEVEVHLVGNKGVSYFRYSKRTWAQQTVDIDEKPRFDQVEPIANDLIDRFVGGEITSAHVAYMHFHSASRQTPALLQLLPLSPQPGTAPGGGNTGSRAVEYELSPDPQSLLDDLLPASVRTQLFQCFTDAAVSEQVARMVAMKAATDAANDMIKSLTRQYNRARQTSITMELLDIIGGSNALA